MEQQQNNEHIPVDDNTITITKKIQIVVNCSDKEELNLHYAQLRSWVETCTKAANFVVNQQHINFNIGERILLYNPELKRRSDTLDIRLNELNFEFDKTRDKTKRVEIKNEKKIIFQEKKNLRNEIIQLEKTFYEKSGSITKSDSDNSPVENSTYQLLSKKFPQLPSYIRSSLNRNVFKNMKSDLGEILKGKKTVRTYKNSPIYFMKSAINNLELHEKKKDFTFNFAKIPLKTYLGKDNSNNKDTLLKVLSGEYKMCDSSIFYKNRKFYLLLVVKKKKKEAAGLSQEISVGVDLGIINPVFLTSTDDNWGKRIGNKKYLFDKKKSMRNQRIALQTALSNKKGGNGYKTKMKKLESISSYEKDFTNTLLHKISKEVIDYTITQKAKIIKMEMLEGISEEDSKLKTLVRFWPVRKLQTLIEQKANIIGIHVVYVDPYHTSQTCSECGHYEEGQRNNRDFLICKNPDCDKFEKKQNSDRNASVNICKSNKYVTKKEQCQMYKIKKEAKKEAEILVS